MAFALYYEAKRAQPATEKEKSAIALTVDRYSSRYEFGGNHEDFGVYEPEPDSGVVFVGSVKIPGEDPEEMFEVANYWLECLTEITRILPNCEWSVTFDDVEMIYDSEGGWRFPTDEEYNG